MPRIFAGALLSVVLAGTACDRVSDGDADVDVAAPRDTLNDSPLDGLSRQQIKRQAEPMSPERAEQLGVVDTTIHLEDPTVNLDTVLPVNVPRPPAREP